MKRIYFALVLCLLSALSFNCQKEFSGAGFNIPNNLPSPITATLQGNILDEFGGSLLSSLLKYSTIKY